jgi:hypothetical protein
VTERQRPRGRPTKTSAERLNPNSASFCVTPAVLDRLDAFCKAGLVVLNRSAVIEVAVVRLLDQLEDNPANLFQK